MIAGTCRTADSETDLIKTFSEHRVRNLLEYVPLARGDNLGVVSSCGEWERPELYCPAGDPPLRGSVFPDLLFSADDPGDTGRPVRFLWGPTPKDGDGLELEELGGYRATRKQ
jgi:hypothetical protein